MAHEIYYWDSSVFIGFLNAEKDKVDAVQQILDEAELGNVTIVTSFMSITEVLCVEDEKPRKMDATKRRHLKGFFQKEYIEWIDFSRTVAEAARELCWDHGLKSKDAVHLASAQFISITGGVVLDAVHSYDSDFTNLNGKVNGIRCKICQPVPKQRVMLLGDARKKVAKKKRSKKN